MYGLFGSDFFEFSDYRVAELTTVEDLRQNVDPTIQLRKSYIQMETGQVPNELLAIRTTPNKAPLRLW